MNLNKVLLIGNLTRDPELRALPSGVKVATFGMATNRVWKDAEGVKRDATEFHNLVAFARPAEVLAQYAKKGSPLYIEGRLQTRSWDDQATGQKKYRTEIVIENFQFGPKSSPGTGGNDFKSQEKPENKKEESDAVDTIEYPEEDINAADIPF